MAAGAAILFSRRSIPAGVAGGLVKRYDSSLLCISPASVEAGSFSAYLLDHVPMQSRGSLISMSIMVDPVYGFRGLSGHFTPALMNCID